MQRHVGREVLDGGNQSAHRAKRPMMLERDVHPCFVQPVVTEDQVIGGGVLVLPHGAGHPERLEDVGLRVVSIIHSRNDLNDLPEEREPEIAVFILDSRYVRERYSALDQPHQFSVRVGQLPVSPGVVLRKPAGVGQQVPNRDLGRVGCQVCEGARLRQVLRDRVVQTQPALVSQLQDGHRRDALAHGGDAKQGVGPGRSHRFQIREPKALGVDQLAVQHHSVCETRHVLPFSILPEFLVDRGRGGRHLFGPVGVGEGGYGLGLQGRGENQAQHEVAHQVSGLFTVHCVRSERSLVIVKGLRLQTLTLATGPRARLPAARHSRLPRR